MLDETLKVLVVEDDPDTQANLRDILALDGHDVALAGTAQAALQWNDWRALSVVILDRRLPDGNAEQLLPRIKQLAPHVEVIVVTGYADLDGTITALRQGAADYILKPIHAEALRASVSRIGRRRQLQHELHEKQELAERTIDTAEAIVLVLDLEGRVVRFNPYMERLSGYRLEEVTGLDWFTKFLPEREVQRVRGVFRDTAQGSVTSGIIYPVVTKDGREREIRWSKTTLKDEDGRIIAVLSVGLDATEFLAAQRRALQSERLAAIGQTMAALAHESRNALQRIQAGVEMIRMELDEGHAAQRDLQKIETAGKSLLNMMEEVRGYSAPMQLERDHCNVARVWRRVWEHLAALRSGRDAEVHEETHDLDLQMSVDVTRLEQVFRNLFENSLAACADPVRISIACSAIRCGDQDAIEFAIRDNGPGLTAIQRERVFEAFFSTKPRGTGPGMAIVKRIVEAHGGQIIVGNSTSGAEFVMTLPRLVP